jgi:D-glycerate 3-kinase
LGLELLNQLSTQEPIHKVAIPVFDKAVDDRTPEEKWRNAITPIDLILFEGWCVGARPQKEPLLASPINALEAKEDPDITWQ